MRRTSRSVGAAALFTVVVMLPGTVQGTAFSPLTPDECPATGALAPGSTVFLFHGASEEARRSIRAGDVLEVLRPGRDGRQGRVGLVRVEVSAGALCLRGTVVEGDLLPQDVVRAGHDTLLVIPAEGPCLLEPPR